MVPAEQRGNPLLENPKCIFIKMSQLYINNLVEYNIYTQLWGAVWDQNSPHDLKKNVKKLITSRQWKTENQQLTNSTYDYTTKQRFFVESFPDVQYRNKLK